MEQLFAIAMGLFFVAAILFSIFYKPRIATCPNGHTRQVRAIGKEPIRAHFFEGGGGNNSSDGLATTRVQFKVFYHCNKCLERWSEIRAE